MKSILKNTISKNKYVKYIGYVKNYKNIFPKVDCLISPSYSEGAGTSVMEAMLSGLYIICYKNSGHNYVLKNTKNYICKINNINNLKYGVEEYLNLSNKELNDISKTSQKRVMNSFSSDLVSKKIVQILNFKI